MRKTVKKTKVRGIDPPRATYDRSPGPKETQVDRGSRRQNNLAVVQKEKPHEENEVGVEQGLPDHNHTA